ncbi:MAG: AAA family ATPase [Acidimicrobiales bacterium]
MTGGPTATPPFVGRTEELAALHDAFEAAADGLVVALVAGDHGVGKTALARAFARDRRAAGVPVHWASCAHLGGVPPFWPWVQVVRSIGAGALDVARADLAERADEPFAAFDILHDLLRAQSSAPQVVVLDDLHAADLGSLELLRFLVSSAADLPLLVVGVHRVHELRTDEARDVALASIASGARRVVPGLLGADEVRQLLGPDPDDAVVADVVARSGGNALYVEQLVDAVLREGSDALARIPDGIRAAVRARLAPLPEGARSLLARATVLASTFNVDVLAEVVGSTPAEVRAELAPARASGLLAEGPDGATFTHVLVRDVLEEELDPDARAGVHVAAARACAARMERGDPMAPAVVAQHLLDAGDAAAPDEAARWSERAADAARAATDTREAARWSEVAAACWARAGDPRAQAYCLAAASMDRSAVGDGAEAVALSSALADLARELDSADLLARAARARAGVFEAGQDVEGPMLLREALDHPDAREDPRRCADLLAALAKLAGMPSMDGVRRDEAAAFAAVAELEELAASGDARCRGRLADAQLNVWSGPAHHEDRVRWLAAYSSLVPAGRDLRLRLDQLYWATSLAFEAGDLHEVDRLIRDWERLADRADSAYWRWRSQMARASLLYAQGRLDAAEALATTGTAWVASLHPVMAFRVVAGLILTIRMDQGRFGEVAGAGSPELGVLSVMAAVERGDEVEARRLLAEVVAAVEATGPDDLYWLCLQSLVALAADALGDEARCRKVADDLEPYVDQVVMWGARTSSACPCPRRSVSPAGAPGSSMRRPRPSGAPSPGPTGPARWAAGRARVGLASVLPPGDARRAALLAEARTTAVRLGMGRVVRQADAAARCCGAGRVDRPQPGATSAEGIPGRGSAPWGGSRWWGRGRPNRLGGRRARLVARSRC